MRSFVAVAVTLLVAACSASPTSQPRRETAATPPAREAPSPPQKRPHQIPSEPGEAPPAAQDRQPTSTAAAQPDWLGTRVLPRRPDGFGEVQPTPRILRDRRLQTVDLLPPPQGDDFVGTVDPVPASVRKRSTWSSRCPVGLDDLRYVTVSFRGFDGLAHTGELLVHRSVARPLTGVFQELYRADFPIEEMRIVTEADVDAPPTGDGNNTTSFVCRATRTSASWSQHAYGLAVDVNPFHNPYVKETPGEDLVLPELASAYLDRDRRRPGMVTPDSVVVKAFSDIGWGWGGRWTSLKDWMHFSANGR